MLCAKPLSVRIPTFIAFNHEELVKFVIDCHTRKRSGNASLANDIFMPQCATCFIRWKLCLNISKIFGHEENHLTKIRVFIYRLLKCWQFGMWFHVNEFHFFICKILLEFVPCDWHCFKTPKHTVTVLYSTVVSLHYDWIKGWFKFAHSQLETALLGNGMNNICNIYFAPLYPIRTFYRNTFSHKPL